ncbi:hypothetical protein DPMN_149813 [Dreissena polymorpha]|uniref:Uncharacterized protein n=1 Tax=Dreissena polymorpha TaxID=45954 RepID=A0A9D4FGQ5_DREPO|nr:hypothetical protein DPMN_149813 [Dreissena polymorpha]
MLVFEVCSFLLLGICTTLLVFAVFYYPGFLYNFCTRAVYAIKFSIHLISFGCEVLIFVGSVILKIIDGLALGGKVMAPYVHRTALYVGEKGSKLVHNFVHFSVRVVANYGGYFIAACGFLAFWTNLLGNNQTRAEKEPEDEDVDNVQRENTADARRKRMHARLRKGLDPDICDLVGDLEYERIKDNTTAIMRAILIQDTVPNRLHTDRSKVARKAGGARRNRSLWNDAVDNDELNSFRPKLIKLLQNSFQNRMHTDTPDAMIDGDATRNGSFGNGVIDEDAVNFFRARLLPNF